MALFYFQAEEKDQSCVFHGYRYAPKSDRKAYKNFRIATYQDTQSSIELLQGKSSQCRLANNQSASFSDSSTRIGHLLWICQTQSVSTISMPKNMAAISYPIGKRGAFAVS